MLTWNQWFPETKNKTLEELAAVFGDKVVDVTTTDSIRERAELEKTRVEVYDDVDRNA